jgi:hypothetical protein
MPHPLEQVPTVKQETFPLCAMDAPNSTIDSNLHSVTGFLRQGGIGEQSLIGKEMILDIGNSVIMFHGDLSMMERLQSLSLYRSIEDSPFQRCQYIIFIPGMFHLKMVAVEAIWKLFISHELKHHDEMSLV